MFKWLARPWFEARSLGVLQAHYDQPLKKPLPTFEARLLRGAVNLTMHDGGTPFDAATRFYAAYAETAIGQGRPLNDIGFGRVLGRLSGSRDKMKFYDEHVAALRLVSAALSLLTGPVAAEAAPPGMISTAAGLIIGVGEIFGGRQDRSNLSKVWFDAPSTKLS